MDEHNKQQPGTAMALPAFRLWLCGTFRLERRVGTGYEAVRTVEWSGSNYPRLLLKALVCRAGRQARREALMELLWPDSEPEQAVHNLNTATSKLRAVLRPAKGQESLLLTENDATMYRLPGQEQLWVDADTALALLHQAEQMERASNGTLALLEEAESYFRQGPFQQEEEGQWVAGRRATVEQARYQGRLWLAEAYERQKMPGQAATTLSTMLEEDPLDEDILCRLMVLLHQQGMTHQALRHYQSLCDGLASEGLEPAEATRTLAMCMQAKRCYAPFVSRDLAHLLSSLNDSSGMTPTIGFDAQKHYKFSTNSSVTSHHTSPQMVSISPQTRAIDTIFAAQEQFLESLFHQQSIDHADVSAQAQHEREQQLGAWLTLSVGTLAPLFDEGWSQEDVLHSMELLLKVVRVMPKDAQPYSRRQLLQLGAAAMLSNIPIPGSKHVSVEDRAALCQAFSDSIIAGWSLLHTAGNAQVLAVSQAQLMLIRPNQSLLYPRVLSVLYSGAYRLKGAALFFQGRYAEADSAHSSAYAAALENADTWNMSQSRTWQAYGYQTNDQHVEAIQAIKAALRLVSGENDKPSQILKSHLLALWAENATMIGEYKTASEKLAASEALLDGIAPNEEFDHMHWLQIAAHCALEVKDYSTAINHLNKALVELPSSWIMRRAVATVPLAGAYARMGERDTSLNIARQAVSLIGTLNAPVIDNQLVKYIRHDLLEVFPRDPLVQEFIADVRNQLPPMKVAVSFS